MSDATDRPLTYGGYLGLDRLLDCQSPRSGEHDELLFIVIHQVSELWLKLCLHELEAARNAIIADEVGPACKMFARVSRVQAQLIQSWESLATMTPHDYLRFRDALGSSSGFQSWQYRHFEFLLGFKRAALLEGYRDEPKAHAELERALHAPSLYDVTLALLARRGFALPPSVLGRDVTQPYEASAEVEAAWIRVYADAEKYWELYELAEKLVDVEYRFQLWRYAHLKTVERVIGFRTGTGGSSGVPYLQRTLSQQFMPELWSVRGKL